MSNVKRKKLNWTILVTAILALIISIIPLKAKDDKLLKSKNSFKLMPRIGILPEYQIPLGDIGSVMGPAWISRFYSSLQSIFSNNLK